nr:hypothetical protein Iba_chr04aCG18110 [Ipomoea batatas]
MLVDGGRWRQKAVARLASQATLAAESLSLLLISRSLLGRRRGGSVGLRVASAEENGGGDDDSGLLLCDRSTNVAAALAGVASRRGGGGGLGFLANGDRRFSVSLPVGIWPGPAMLLLFLGAADAAPIFWLRNEEYEVGRANAQTRMA